MIIPIYRQMKTTVFVLVKRLFKLAVRVNCVLLPDNRDAHSIDQNDCFTFCKNELILLTVFKQCVRALFHTITRMDMWTQGAILKSRTAILWLDSMSPPVSEVAVCLSRLTF